MGREITSRHRYAGTAIGATAGTRVSTSETGHGFEDFFVYTS